MQILANIRFWQILVMSLFKQKADIMLHAKICYIVVYTYPNETAIELGYCHTSLLTSCSLAKCV
ncbi:hypothetical protein SD81_035025 [Tolypothrix campylonemoides VB511288]|nr:hypothetical protein SD81_035025 [Tolypothrix campylonemoides VB511288]